MIEKIISYLVLFGVGFLTFFSVRENIFSKRKHTDTTRTELDEVGKHQQDATREVKNARTTTSEIRQSTTELADTTRTSQSIIDECKRIIEGIRENNDLENLR